MDDRTMNSSESKWESDTRLKLNAAHAGGRPPVDVAEAMPFERISEPLHLLRGLTPHDTGPGIGLHNEVDIDRAKTILSVTDLMLHTAQYPGFTASLFHHMKLSYATTAPLWARVRASAT